MIRSQPDSGPSVWMHSVYQPPEQVPEVAVWPVEACLFELLKHYVALHLERLRRESRSKHAVAFEPEQCFGVGRRSYGVEVGEVVVGPCVVPSASPLCLPVEVRHVD